MTLEEFDKQLETRFPLVLKRWWEVECPSGWYPLVLDLLVQLENHAKTVNGNVEVAQIKSKFGGLRCCLSESDDLAERMIAAAEAKSTKICEVCGKPGERVIRGRVCVETVCQNHRTVTCP